MSEPKNADEFNAQIVVVKKVVRRCALRPLNVEIPIPVILAAMIEVIYEDALLIMDGNKEAAIKLISDWLNNVVMDKNENEK